MLEICGIQLNSIIPTPSDSRDSELELADVSVFQEEDNDDFGRIDAPR